MKVFSRQARARRKIREPLPGKTRIAIGAIALGLFLAGRLFPEAVESVYGLRAYPWIAGAVASVSSAVPFGLAEWVSLLILLSILWAVPTYAKRMRRALEGWPRSLAAGLLGLAGRIAFFWTAFVVLWGFHYARPPAERRFDLAPPLAKARRAELVRDVAREVDSARTSVPEDEEGVVADPEEGEALGRHLLAIQAGVLRDLGLPPIETGRPKRPLTSPLLLRWGISGFYGPFTAEPHVVTPSPPGLLPFTTAHELAHLSGFATEDSASLLAFLTCWRSERPEVRYSAWLRLYLDAGGRPEGRCEAVVRDLRAIAGFFARHRRGKEADAVWKGYDRFLEAHGVKGGTQGYARATDLVLRWIAGHGMPREPLPAGRA